MPSNGEQERHAEEAVRDGRTPPASGPGVGVGQGERVVRLTRTGAAFIGAVVGLLIALMMLVFVLQNGADQELTFLWADFTLPAGVALLLAAVAGGLAVAALGIGRVLQIRHAEHRRERTVASGG